MAPRKKLRFNVHVVLRRIHVAVAEHADAAMFELAERGFRSVFQQLVAHRAIQQKSRQMAARATRNLAGPTGLEPATSGVTGRRSNQLNYDPAVGTRSLTCGVQVAFPSDGASYGRGRGVSRSGQGEVEAEGEERDQPSEEDDEGGGEGAIA